MKFIRNISLKIDQDILELKKSILNLSDYKKDLSEQIAFSLMLFKNIQLAFENSDVETKQKTAEFDI